MRSWRGLLGQPLRGPASGRNLERGGGPVPTENHVSHANYWTKFISMCKHCNNTLTITPTYQSLSLSLHFLFISLPVCTVRRTLKNGLTTEEANALGLSSGSEMQVWAGHKDVWKPFHCPLNAHAQTGNPLHSGLALKMPPVLMSWPHLYLFGLHQACFPKRVDKRWCENLYMNWWGRDSRNRAPHSNC